MSINLYPEKSFIPGSITAKYCRWGPYNANDTLSCCHRMIPLRKVEIRRVYQTDVKDIDGVNRVAGVAITLLRPLLSFNRRTDVAVQPTGSCPKWWGGEFKRDRGEGLSAFALKVRHFNDNIDGRQQCQIMNHFKIQLGSCQVAAADFQNSFVWPPKWIWRRGLHRTQYHSHLKDQPKNTNLSA